MSLKTRTEYPEALKDLSEQVKQLYHTLDDILDMDICFYQNCVVIQVRLGEQVIGQIPLTYEFKDKEIEFKPFLFKESVK